MALRHWDARLHAYVGGLPASPADVWLRRLTTFANGGKLWLLVAGVLALRRGTTRRAALRGVFSMTVASIVANSLLKPLFRRVRPDFSGHAPLRQLRRPPASRSFPSGHSATAAGFVTGVAMENPLAGAALAPLAVGVGYSRVHVGVHYPGDVVVGMAVGGALAAAGQRWWPVRPSTPARVRPAHEAPALPGGDGLVVAVNPRSGPDDYDPAQVIRHLLPGAEVREVTEDVGVTEILEKAVRGGARALGVAGGDGSVAAAAAVALAAGLPLAVVPAGTLNHFARDVGVETPEDAADAVVSGSAVEVDVAEVNGTPFLNTSSIGAYPEMVDRRDRLEHRLGKWVGMAVAAAQVLHHGEPLDVEIDGRRHQVWIIFVGNCCYHPRGLSPAWRPRLDDGLLDVQYLRADLRFDRTRAVLATLLGVGDRSRSYGQFETAEDVRVVCHSGPQPIAYDGETGDDAGEFVFRKGKRLTVYCCRTD